jgi:predicted dienelactone hydrolase
MSAGDEQDRAGSAEGERGGAGSAGGPVGRRQTPRRPWRVLRRVVRIGLVGLLAVLVLAGGYVGYAAVRHVRVVTLPAPTGRYSVGRTAYDWTDGGRTDPLAPRAGMPRELSVWLWYPAARSGGTAAPYAPGAWAGLHVGGVAGWGETTFGAIRTHSVAGAPVAGGRFPVAVLEPGLGLAAPQLTTVAENLASHGWLVAGVTPTYSANVTVLHGRAVSSTAAGDPGTFTTADGDRLIVTWAADARFAADRVASLDRSGRFAGHVDRGRTVDFGHSFGGAASLQACADDPGCKGAADLDGTAYGTVVHTGLHAPVMIIGSDGSCTTGTCRPATADDRTSQTQARSLLAATSGPAWCLSIRGTEHFNFTDYAAYYLAAPLRTLVPVGDIDGPRGLAITNAYLTAFLDHAARGTTEPLLAGPSHPYPEVRMLHASG